MNILNDAPTDPRVSGLLYERVRVFLNKKLEPFALNSADVYINTVDDPINQRMVSSQSLYEEAIDSLERGSEPTYVQGITYVFSLPWTFEQAYSLRKPSLDDVEKIMRSLLEEAKHQWRV